MKIITSESQRTRIQIPVYTAPDSIPGVVFSALRLGLTHGSAHPPACSNRTLRGTDHRKPRQYQKVILANARNLPDPGSILPVFRLNSLALVQSVEKTP